jgi:hypothetical protein
MIILVTDIVFSSFFANRLTTQWYVQLKLKHARIFQNFGEKVLHIHNKFSTDKPLLLHDCSNQPLKLQ